MDNFRMIAFFDLNRERTNLGKLLAENIPIKIWITKLFSCNVNVKKLFEGECATL
jgi:hypothetical protein